MLLSPSRSMSPTTPRSPPKRSRLGMSGVANLFIRMRRLEESTVGKQQHTVITSGEPKTHPGIAEGSAGEETVSVEYVDHFVCVGGVNVATLLRAGRAGLLQRVSPLGANALLNEEWEVSISGPKPLHGGAYKVQVRYMGLATKSSTLDPQRPVALEKAKGIPGLMTIVKRGEDH